MADMDFDEIPDGPIKAPSRTTRFAPKGSKFKPKTKTEPSEPLPPPASGCMESLPVPKKEELGIKPETKPECADDAFEMDVDVKPEIKEENADDLMKTQEMEAEFEDEVVREIDVYLTPSFDSNTRLYVLQYPLRPLWRPYELDDRCEAVRVKPGSSEVEIDLTIQADSKNYNPDADPRVQMEKQSLTTIWKPPQKSGYAVGVLTGNKLHLNPIHAVVQLRPSMQHLDSCESKKQAVGPSKVEKKVKSEEPQGGKPSSSKKVSNIPEQTEDNEERWIPLEYHNTGSHMTTQYLHRMMAEKGSQIDFSMSSFDYLNSLCPGTSTDSSSSKGPPLRFLLTLPLRERFRTWLLEGPPVHRFNALKYLAPDESVEEVLEVLQEHARLVQGLWVPKSSLLYGKDMGTDCGARDYVLLLFSKNVIIKNIELERHAKIRHAAKEVVKSFAVERTVLGDWKFKELPDLSFQKSNPTLVRRQEEAWKCTEEKFNSFSGKNIAQGTKPSALNNPTTKKCSGEAAAAGNPSRAAMSEDVRESITKALQKLFKSVKICNFQQIGQLLRVMAVSESARATGFAKVALAAANSIDEYPDVFKAIVNQIAVNIHGTCVPKSSPDNPQYDPFRKVVIDLLIAQGPNAKLKKASILEAARLELKREIHQNEFQKVLTELCTSQGSAWTLKPEVGIPKR